MISVDDVTALRLEKVVCSSCGADEWGLLVIVSLEPNVAFYVCDSCRRHLIFCLVDQAKCQANIADLQVQLNAMPAGCIKFGCAGKVMAVGGQFACSVCQEPYGPVRI